MQAAWVGVRLMAGYRALGEGASPAMLGLLAATLALPALLGALPIGRISDRVGGSLISFLGIVVIIAGTLLMVCFRDLWVLFVTAAVVGLGQVCVMVGQQTFVAHRIAADSSDRDFGTLTSAASLGQLIGAPLVTTVVALLGARGGAHPDTTAGLLATIACAVVATPIFFLLRRVDGRSRTARLDPGRPARDVPLRVLGAPGLWRALVVSAAVLVTADLMYAFMPVWAIEHHVDISAVGWLLAIRAVVSMSSRIGLSRLVARFGRKVLLAAAMLIGAASLIALPFVGEAGAIVAMVGLGIALGLPQPLTMSWVVAVSRPENHGAALGLRITANRLAQITIPVAVSALTASFGVTGIFWANAAFLAGAVAFLAGADPDHRRTTDE
ncbi:MAG: transporter [Rhodoglobus sp.]|jgi:MFS family permease|nr:transporter [Rhodoglobus sp.]